MASARLGTWHGGHAQVIGVIALAVLLEKRNALSEFRTGRLLLRNRGLVNS